MLCSAWRSAAVRERAGMGFQHEEPQKRSPQSTFAVVFRVSSSVLPFHSCLGAKLKSTWAMSSMSSASHGSFEGDAASLKRRLTIGTDTGQLAKLVSEAQAVAKQSQVQHAGAPVGRKHTRKYASALLPAA